MSDELDNRRNWVAQKLCNAILNIVATKTYRNFIDGAIRLGMTSAAQKVQREDPADIRGISMEMREQRLGQVQTTQFDAAELPPDMSGFKMTTIREGAPPRPAPDTSSYKMETIRDPGSLVPAFILGVVIALVIVLILAWVS